MLRIRIYFIASFYAANRQFGWCNDTNLAQITNRRTLSRTLGRGGIKGFGIVACFHRAAVDLMRDQNYHSDQ